mmetsp:Transcript_11858/g.21729  ORF Transcript_11858/g.21729 Transcript_11858/m.21729 type:complete len:306 (-) Transcript_11858:585-1502(-)
MHGGGSRKPGGGKSRGAWHVIGGLMPRGRGQGCGGALRRGRGLQGWACTRGSCGVCSRGGCKRWLRQIHSHRHRGGQVCGQRLRDVEGGGWEGGGHLQRHGGGHGGRGRPQEGIRAIGDEVGGGAPPPTGHGWSPRGGEGGGGWRRCGGLYQHGTSALGDDGHGGVGGRHNPFAPGGLRVRGCWLIICRRMQRTCQRVRSRGHGCGQVSGQRLRHSERGCWQAVGNVQTRWSGSGLSWPYLCICAIRKQGCTGATPPADHGRRPTAGKSKRRRGPGWLIHNNGACSLRHQRHRCVSGCHDCSVGA